MKKNNSTTTQRDRAHATLIQLLTANPFVWYYATRHSQNWSIVKLFAVNKRRELVDITRDAYFAIFNRYYTTTDPMHFQIAVKNSGGLDAGDDVVQTLSTILFDDAKVLNGIEIS